MENGAPMIVRLVRNHLVACLILAIATAVAFWPVVHADFINYDDLDYVTENRHVQDGLTRASVVWAFRSVHSSNWHPLTWLSHMADVQFFGHGPTAPHVVNLFLHILNGLLLFWLLRNMTGAIGRSFFVAGLFALHPLHVESVAWIAERKDVLSTCFGMLTLLAYAQYVKLSESQNPGSTLSYSVSVLCFALALLSKPMLVTLPCVMLLIDFWPLRRLANGPTGRLLAEKIPFALLSAASSVITVFAQQGAMQPLLHLPLGDRVGNSLVSYARYLGKSLWPVDLAIPYLLLRPWPMIVVVLAATLILLITFLVIRSRDRFPFALTGWLWFLGTLIPVIGLIQVGAQAMADRYTYLPLVGIFIIAAWGTPHLLKNLHHGPVAIPLVALFVLASCAVLTRRQVRYWQNSETLFTHAAAVTENNYLALCNVAGSLFDRGQLTKALELYQEAARMNPNHADALNSIGAILAAKGDDDASNWFRRTLLLQPDHADALFNMGNAMIKQGQQTEAVVYYERALQLKPENSEMRNNLANSLLKLGKVDDAVSQYRLALRDNPEDATVLRNLASVLAAKRQLDEAIFLYRKSLKFAPDATAHYGLGLAFAVKGSWKEAIAQYQETLRLSPTNAEAEYNLGYALRVEGRPDEAAAHLRVALRLKPGFPLAHFNLACVLSDSGQREEAYIHLKEALRLKPDYDDARQRLEALEKQQ